MKKYNINEELIDKYVKREMSKKMMIISIILITLLTIVLVFTFNYDIDKGLVFKLTIIFLVVFGISYISGSIQLTNIIKMTDFIFSEDSVSKLLNKEKLDLITKAAISKGERKYGVKYNQTIKLNEIKNTLVKENEIIIKSIYYNFITSNGKIIIPKEIENYDVIKSKIFENSIKYKLKDNNSL